MNAKTKHGLSTLNPLAGAKASLELEGAHAKVHLHVCDPAIYLSLAARDQAEQVISHAITVNTGGAKDVANRKHGAHSAASGFAIVRVDERQAVRIVGAIHVSPTGAVTQDEDVMPAKVEVMPGKHWLKITPKKPLPSASMRWWRSSPPPRSTSRSGTSAWTRSRRTIPAHWDRF